MSGGSSTEPKHDDARAPNPAPAGGYWRAVRLWFDAGAAQPGTGADGAADRIEWARILPFIGMHVACLAVYWVGASRIAIGTAAVLYAARMVAITGFYHRYFSHRTFKTSRVGQFVFGVLGASAVQRGPLWWAAHHRHHHAYSDRPEDLHSPRQRGFLWSHMGWFVSKRGFVPDYARVKDLLRYPELRLLDRFDILVPVAFAVGHVGATLIVAAGLASALAAGLLSKSIAYAADVGMSYGAVGVLGTFTAAIPPRWRAPWIGWWLAVAAGSAVLSGGSFTNAGHAVALVLGMVVGTRFGQPERWTVTRCGLLAVAAVFGYFMVGYNELSIATTAAFGVVGALAAWGGATLIRQRGTARLLRAVISPAMISPAIPEFEGCP